MQALLCKSLFYDIPFEKIILQAAKKITHVPFVINNLECALRVLGHSNAAACEDSIGSCVKSGISWTWSVLSSIQTWREG